MRRKSSTFFLFDVAFLANSRWRKLAKRLPDPDDFNSAVGAYVIALAAARSNGLPDLCVEEETDSRFVADLVAVGLLTPTGFPLKPWGEYAPARPSYPSDQRVPNAPSVPNAPHDSEPSIPLPSITSEEDSTKTTTFSTQSPASHYPVPDSDMDSLDAYYELTRFRPWGQFSGDKLRVAMQEYGDSTTTTALRVEFAADPDRKTVLDRTLARLAKAAEKARLERPAKPKARVAPIDKAAYDAAYRDLLVVRPQEEQG